MDSQNVNEEEESVVNTAGNYSAMSSESSVAHDSLKWKEVVGNRFRPSDEILAGFYLAGKVSGRTDGPIFKQIKEGNIYEHKPSDLPSLGYAFDDGMMYFFTPIQKKYGKKGKNIDRIAPGGSWKITGKSFDVNGKDGKPIAKRTSLAYFKNDPISGKAIVKTQWLMKEYMLLENESKSNENPNESTDSMTLCVVYFHGNKRKRCRIEMPDMVEGSTEVLATTAANSCSFLPSPQNSNLDYQQNLGLSPAENSRKRYRPASDLYEKKFDEYSIFFNENRGNGSSSDVPPTFYSSSNPAGTQEQGLPSPNAFENMLNMSMGSSGATNPNALILNQQSPCTELDPETIRYCEDLLYYDSLNNPQIWSGICPSPSIDDLSDEIGDVNHNLDPIMNSAEPLWFTALQAFENTDYI